MINEDIILNCYVWILDARRNSKFKRMPAKYKLLNTADNACEGLTILDFIKHGNESLPEEKGIAFLWKNMDYLHVYGVFEDSDVFNAVVETNGKMWQYGDVMQFFFQAHGAMDYYQLLLTPENLLLKFHLPVISKNSGTPFDDRCSSPDFYYHADRFKCSDLNLNGWYAHMKIPLKELGVMDNNLNKARFSVCRYNYNKKWKVPELSSTSYYPTGSFRQPKYWHEIVMTKKVNLKNSDFPYLNSGRIY